MAGEYKQSPEIDLDKTDRLPILEGMPLDPEVADDAVPMDQTAVLPAGSFGAGAHSDFARTSGVDLPSLAQSVRSVEERIARQNTEYEALTRAFERARDAEAALSQRAQALTAELAAARTALDAEQSRSHDLERVLAERGTAAETARSRAEAALRESERYQSEARTLRESLAARDANLVQVLHSLGERDAQLSALQQEHAKIVPALEATAKSTSQLEADLHNARADTQALAAELEAGRQTVAASAAQLRRGEAELNAVHGELGAAKAQAISYLDLLRTREWRRGFDENLFRDLDAQVGAAHAGHGVLESERARLQGEVAALEAKLTTQAAEGLSERARLTGQLAARDRSLAESHLRGSGDAEKVAELQQAAKLSQTQHTAQIAQLHDKQAAQIAQLREERAAQLEQLRAEQAAQIERLHAEAQAREQEMAALTTQLQETRRPIQAIEEDLRRLTAELAAKAAAFAQSEEENRTLRANLDRTRGALEEREFLIRRLERSESNNANVLGRIQTSIERLGSVPSGASAAPAPAEERSAELIRTDGESPVAHVLARRTRIGRAAGCELQIDSSSVSRHHALLLVGPRETVIEDLNSTNGVLVNGRKVTRQVLNDGDSLTFGETKFRYIVKSPQRPSATRPGEPAAEA
jgi:chromosome segregation ATPase